MKDLKLNYTTSYGGNKTIEYHTIMDFTDSFEAKKVDTEGTMAKAIFFEKESFTKSFNTLKELYDFCIEIMK